MQESQTQRAATNSEVMVPASTVPQLPPSVAKHPLLALVFAVLTIFAGNYWTAQNAGEAMKDEVVELRRDLTAQGKEVAEIKQYLQRHLDKHEDRIQDLERAVDSIYTYHTQMDAHMRERTSWSQTTQTRIDKLERHHD